MGGAYAWILLSGKQLDSSLGSKLHLIHALRVLLDALEGPLGANLEAFGRSCRLLEALGAGAGASWALLGSLGGILGDFF